MPKPQFEIVTADGNVHGPYAVKELPAVVASLPPTKEPDSAAPHRGVRVVGCEPPPDTPH